jgi:hypothetical protein
MLPPNPLGQASISIPTKLRIVYDADMADSVSPPGFGSSDEDRSDRYDLSRFNWHGAIACIAAAVTLGLLATWSSGHISPRIQSILLLTTLAMLATSVLGTIVAFARRRERPLASNLALIFTAAVLAITIALLLQGPQHPLARALHQLFF